MMLAPLLFLLLSMVLPIMAVPAPAKAEDWGGISMTGSFYTQSFEIPQGSSVSGPSIYVTVGNTSNEVLRVIMHSTVPDGVTVTLSHAGIGLGPAEDFFLSAGEQRQLLIAVAVADVPPGTYSIMISAEGFRDTGEGLSIVGSAAEEASLTVIGESALVTVDSIAPSGEPVTATIRLFRVIGDNQYECATSTTGHLEARVSPGHYVVWAEMNGSKQGDEMEFDLVAEEQKSVSLTIEIIYFELFDILPAYHPQTNELGVVQISYTVRNVYQQVDSAEVRLVVTLNGAPLEEIPGILNVSPLYVGRIGTPYDYSPAWGWEDGTYGFSLRLFINGELYASTNEKTLDVDVPGGSSSLLFIILGIIGGGLLLGILIFVVARRKKRGEKPEKAAKKKAKVKVDEKARAKEEAPTPAAPAPGVDILFGREMPELKDAEEPAPGLAKTEAAAPPKEAAKASAPVTPAAKPVVEKPAAPKPPEGVRPAGPAKEAVPPSAAAPKPPQPSSGVRPAEAKPVQTPGAPKPAASAPPTAKPTPDSGAVKPTAPSAPPKAEPPVHKPAAEPAKPAGPQPTAARPAPTPEPAKPAGPAAPKVVVPPVLKPAARPVRPPPPTPRTRGAEGPAAPAAPGTGREADSLRQMPREKAIGKPDLKVVSALEQRMSRVRKGSQPDSGKAGAEGTEPGENRPSGTATPRPATEKPVTNEGSPEEPAVTEEPVQDRQRGTGGAAPDKAEAADEAAAAKPASTEDDKAQESDQADKDEDEEGGKDKKFTSPIRFLNQ